MRMRCMFDGAWWGVEEEEEELEQATEERKMTDEELSRIAESTVTRLRVPEEPRRNSTGGQRPATTSRKLAGLWSNKTGQILGSKEMLYE